MPCEKYQEVLIDLAASGAEPVGVVRSHLDGCGSCRSYLKEQQMLLAAIDSGVRQTINAPVPASLLQRFGARLAQQTAPRHSQSARWMCAGAAFATVAVLVLYAFPHLRLRVIREHASEVSQAAHAAIEQPQEIRPLELLLQPAAPGAARNLGKHLRTSGTNAQPEVLVPPDERVAFEHFLSDLNGREDLAAAIVKPIHAQAEQRVISLDTPDVETAALTVEPIQDVSDR
jgi:hypothetical protein